MIETPYANSIFEQPWWLDIVAPGFWSESVVKEHGKVIARLPYCYNGHSIFMPKLTQTLGPWMVPNLREKIKGNCQLSRQKEIINCLLAQLPAYKSFQICMDNRNDYILPYRWHGFRYEPSFSYRITNLENLDIVFSNFHKQVKKNIKKCEKTCRVSEEVDPDILISVMNKTYEHQGRNNPLSNKLVRDIVEVANKNKRGHMFTAKDLQGNIQVSAFMIFDNNRAYALMSGSDPKYRGSGSKSLIYWRQIQFAQQYTREFDFEGSNIEGIENIVRQFGGQYVVNYNVAKKGIIDDCIDMLKPRVKRLIGYKI
ncbi:GNAT family N-acetyltransferase [Selenomonas caprae]|uniref:GNAT family N-acetyltransferase n=1 Tax=Selenomonas caprae TaxID=2606905 RepID=A0A5D6WPM9_9FIRM|nr:GNAT family N-acetyltransferase [Selenomonas caprae]TYZ29115.1 GNAT family N-acetyltransferase [Selenomonas caprae]